MRPQLEEVCAEADAQAAQQRAASGAAGGGTQCEDHALRQQSACVRECYIPCLTHPTSGVLGKGGAKAQASANLSGPRFSSTALDDSGAPVVEEEALSRFFRRLNKAVLDKAAVDKERGRLEKENADLR